MLNLYKPICCTICMIGFLISVFIPPLQGQDSSYPTGTITGYVQDTSTSEPLAYANVFIEHTEYGTTCDANGRFSLNLPEGPYTLLCSYVGYLSKRIVNIHITSGSEQHLEIYLTPTSILSSEVVITATQRSQHIHLAPASLGIVSQDDLHEKQISTFDQAFDHITGVEVTRSSGSNVQAFSIRGASEVAGGGIGNRVLLLIDGRPAISPESGGALWNLVPLSSIDHVEVVKGAYSSLYGSSAMGGVVNVITRKPAADPVTHVNVNYGFYDKAPDFTGYTRIGDYNTISYSRSHAKGKFSYLFDVARRQDDGHREKSGYTLYQGFTRLQYDLSQHRTMHFSLNMNKISNDTPASWLSIFKPYSVAEYRRDDFQNRREWNADLQYHSIANARTKYDSRFYYYDNYSRFSFNDDPENDSTNVNTGRQHVDQNSVKAMRIGNVSQVDIAAGNHHYLIGGIDVKYDWINGLPDTVLYGRHKAASLGAYMQDEITFDDIVITGGIRFDHYSIISEFNESNVSPKLAMVWTMNKKLSIRALLAQAFRNPSMAERFIKFEQGGGLRFEPNASLRAEKLKLSAEVGMRFSISTHANLDAALFYNQYNDLISYQQVSAPLEPLVFRVVNLTKALMQGIEVNLNYSVPEKLNLRMGYTFLDARDVSPGRLNDALAYKVKHTIIGSATGYIGDLTLNASARFRSAVEEVFIYPGSEPEANLLIHAKVAYRLLDKHQLYIAVNNITNEQYEELERYRMAGRSYTAGMMLIF